MLVGGGTRLHRTSKNAVLRLSAVLGARRSLLPVTLVIDIATVELRPVWPGVASAVVGRSRPC